MLQSAVPSSKQHPMYYYLLYPSAMIKSGDRDFPVRMHSRHVCNAHIFPLVAPAIKCMMSLRSRQLLTLHNGSNDELLESLAACSLPPTAVPTCMGGLLDVSLEDLFKARLAIEAARDNEVSEVNHSTNQDGNISDVSTSDSKPSSLPPRSSSSTNQTARLELVGDISDVSMMTDHLSDTSIPNSSKKSLAPASASASPGSKPMSLPRKSSSKHRGKIRKCPGRSGDTRMHKAVDARRQNPEMSLLDALLAGGFVFPDVYATGIKQSEAKDIDGVSVAQRKNQLMRRLRLDKKQKPL